MTRGEIWWVDFGLAFGSMTLGRRPAIIVQNDNFNAQQYRNGCRRSIDYKHLAR